MFDPSKYKTKKSSKLASPLRELTREFKSCFSIKLSKQADGSRHEEIILKTWVISEAIKLWNEIQTHKDDEFYGFWTKGLEKYHAVLKKAAAEYDPTDQVYRIGLRALEPLPELG